MASTVCPQCKGPHTLSQCPNWRVRERPMAARLAGFAALAWGAYFIFYQVTR